MKRHITASTLTHGKLTLTLFLHNTNICLCTLFDQLAEKQKQHHKHIFPRLKIEILSIWPQHTVCCVDIVMLQCSVGLNKSQPVLWSKTSFVRQENRFVAHGLVREQIYLRLIPHCPLFDFSTSGNTEVVFEMAARKRKVCDHKQSIHKYLIWICVILCRYSNIRYNIYK